MLLDSESKLSTSLADQQSARATLETTVQELTIAAETKYAVAEASSSPYLVITSILLDQDMNHTEAINPLPM
jgi:hypothetical protein